MFDEELPKSKTKDFPRNIVDMSIEELGLYITELTAEVSRCEKDISAKEASLDAAASIFKS